MSDNTGTIEVLTEYLTECEQAAKWSNGAQRSRIALNHVPAMIEALEQNDNAAYQTAAADYTAAMADHCQRRADDAVELPEDGILTGLAEGVLANVESMDELLDWVGTSPDTADGFAITRIEDDSVHVEAWFSHHNVFDDRDHRLFGEEVETATAIWPLDDVVAMTDIIG